MDCSAYAGSGVEVLRGLLWMFFHTGTGLLIREHQETRESIRPSFGTSVEPRDLNCADQHVALVLG